MVESQKIQQRKKQYVADCFKNLFVENKPQKYEFVNTESIDMSIPSIKDHQPYGSYPYCYQTPNYEKGFNQIIALLSDIKDKNPECFKIQSFTDKIESNKYREKLNGLTDQFKQTHEKVKKIILEYEDDYFEEISKLNQLDFELQPVTKAEIYENHYIYYDKDNKPYKFYINTSYCSNPVNIFQTYVAIKQSLSPRLYKLLKDCPRIKELKTYDFNKEISNPDQLWLIALKEI